MPFDDSDLSQTRHPYHVSKYISATCWMPFHTGCQVQYPILEKQDDTIPSLTNMQPGWVGKGMKKGQQRGDVISAVTAGTQAPV